MKKGALFLFCSVLLVLASALHAADGIIVYSYSDDGKSNTPYGGGVWLGSSKSNDVKKLWGNRGDEVFGAMLGPEGKKIAFVHNNLLYIMFNDGKNVQTYRPGLGWPPSGGYCAFDFTVAGIFWARGNTVFRYDPSNDKTYSYSPQSMGTFREIIRMSNDGKTGFCVCKSETGGNRIIKFNDAFSSMTASILYPLPSRCPPYLQPGDGNFGHGDCILPDGSVVFQSSWCGEYGDGFSCPKPDGSGSTHRVVNVFDVAANKPLTSLCAAPIVGINILTLCNWEVPEAVVNSNDHLVFADEGPDKSTVADAWIINWRTKSRTATIPQPPGQWPSIQIGNGWLGDVPSPYSGMPFIEIDKKHIAFTDAGSKDVAASNIGPTTMGKVEINVTPANASTWLATDVAGSGGNSQTIGNTVTTSGVQDGEYTAQVTVSGGGAPNAVAYTVTLIKGSTLGTPTQLLAATLDDSLGNLELSWTDNSNDEDGYSIERKAGGGSWKEIKRTGSVSNIFTTTKYEDNGLMPGTYEYRVRAFKGSNNGPYSETVLVLMVGYPFIRITSPSSGDKYLVNTECAIEWEANLVNEVVLEYSTDDGLTWQPITASKNVLKDDPDWGRFIWTTPGQAASEAIVRAYRYSDLKMLDVSDKFSITNDASEILPWKNGMSTGKIMKPVVYDVFSLSGRKVGIISARSAADLNAIRKSISQGGLLIIREREESKTVPHKVLNINK